MVSQVWRRHRFETVPRTDKYLGAGGFPSVNGCPNSNALKGFNPLLKRPFRGDLMVNQQRILNRLRRNTLSDIKAVLASAHTGERD
jgi:hypothetical protein